MTRLAHALFGIGLTLMAWRALAQEWPDQFFDPTVATALRIVFPLAAATGSVLAIAAGFFGHDPTRSFRHDALSAIALFVGLFFVALGPTPRDMVGLVAVVVLAARLAPAAWVAVRFGAPPLYIFALCVAAYGGIATWRVASSLPLGDQVFYLLAADRLAHGDLDATIDAGQFTAIVGIPPQPSDTATHVVDTPVGPRLIQGYALPALLSPGRLIAGELGATLVIAIVAAFAAMQTWSLLGETVPDQRVARLTWSLIALLAPFSTLAVHLYPNVLGAALITTAFRYLFTARHRRPLLAGVLLGATVFLNPRDGLALIALAPFVAAQGRTALVRFAIGSAALVIASAVAGYLTHGIPLPYPGYVIAVAAPPSGLPSTFTFAFWVGLPAMLFDRTFGLAAFAPWIFLAALGAAPALRADRPRLLPAAVVVVASLVVLSLYRYWEGGYAPPGRYIVDVLPLIAPFVAYGLMAARSGILRAGAFALVAAGAVATLAFAAVPTTVLNTAFEDKLQALLDVSFGRSPLGWLPSFQPTTPDWYIGAYLRLVPAVLAILTLAWLGARRRGAP